MTAPPGNTINTRESWIDGLRLLAGLSMVGLHASADANGQPFPRADAMERVAPMLLRSVLYVARTELFLLISVFLLLLALHQRPRSYGATIQQQASRLLPPFLFWTVFFAFYNLFKANIFSYSSDTIAVLTNVASWPEILFLGSIKYHMHFIPTLCGLLLFYPLFLLANRHPVLGLSIIGFLALKWELDHAIYKSFWGSDALPALLRTAKILTYVGYGLAAAAMLSLFQRYSQAERRQWAGLILLSLGLLFCLKLYTARLVIHSGQWAFDFQPGYWADFLMPVLLMLLCMSLGNSIWPSWVSRAAKFSFGTYLCHPIFLDLSEIALRTANLSPIALVAAKLAFTLPASMLFVFALSRSRACAWTIGLGPRPRLNRFPADRPAARPEPKENSHAHQS